MTDRTVETRFKVTRQEREMIDAAVAILGIPLASFVRPLVLREARRVLGEAKAAREETDG